MKYSIEYFGRAYRITFPREEMEQLAKSCSTTERVAAVLPQEIVQKMDVIASGFGLWVVSYFPMILIEPYVTINTVPKDGEVWHAPEQIQGFAKAIADLFESERAASQMVQEYSTVLSIPYGIKHAVNEHTYLVPDNKKPDMVVAEGEFADGTKVSVSPVRDAYQSQFANWEYEFRLPDGITRFSAYMKDLEDMTQEIQVGTRKKLVYSVKIEVAASLWRRQETSSPVLYSPRDVIVYEMQNLGNSDIPDTVYDRFVATATPEFRKQYKIQIGLIEDYLEVERQDGYVASTAEYTELAQAILDIVKGATGKDIKYVLWLAEKEVVNSFYKNDGVYLCEYEVSDVILSDLGHDGWLFGYTERPKPSSISLDE